MEKCKQINSTQNQIFKLSSKQLICFPKSWLNHLIDFNLIINENLIGINYSLFSCVCEKLLQLDYQENELALSISNESLNCFFSFFEIMKGFSFSFENIPLSSFKLLIDCFEIKYFCQYIDSNFPFPQTLEESLQFISYSSCEFLEKQFNKSLSIIIHNFHLLSFDDLNHLSNSNLLKIFSSESLQLENEDYLFQLIIN
jgi:hypothetical protein